MPASAAASPPVPPPAPDSAGDILIFGASRVGIRLAERLADRGQHLRLIDPAPAPDDRPHPWVRLRSDFVVPADVGHSRVVYIVTDEDKLNLRLALAVRQASATVPIVITLTQSRLGEQLSAHLGNFAFLNPPALAAGKFVDAIHATAPAPSRPLAPAAPPPPAEARERWRLDPLILRAVLVIAAIGVLATVYFHFAERLRWIDSLYFVVTMMATVGFGDISLRDSSTLSKIVGICVMVASVVNTAVVFALITDSLLKKRLVLSFGRRHVGQSGHIVVAGMGSVGLRVVEELQARGESIVVIDSQANSRHLPTIYARRLPAIIGDARSSRVLRDAGLPRAKAILSVTNDDLTNLEIGLNARWLHPQVRIVLRIFDQELASSLHSQLDLHFAFSMSAIAAEVLTRYADAPPRSAVAVPPPR